MFFRSSKNTNNLNDDIKAQLLISLFNNAKMSQRTRNVIFLTMVPDHYLINALAETYKKDIDAEVENLNLSLPEALAILRKNKFVDYIGPVEIKIDFSEDQFNTNAYDKAHCTNKNENVKPASVIIDEAIAPSTRNRSGEALRCYTKRSYVRAV